MGRTYQFINNLTQESKDIMLVDGLARSNDDIVNLALLAGANPLVGGPKMRCWAARFGRNDILKKFLDKGEWDVVHSNLPFKTAAANGRLPTVKLLLKAGANPSHAVGDAVENGETEVLEYLLMSGAKIHLNSEITKAASNGHSRMVEFLLQHGANPTRAIPFAIINDHAKVIKVLIAYGAEISQASLIMAVQQHRYDVLLAMLKNVEEIDAFTRNYLKDLLPPERKDLHRILKEKFGE